MYPTGSRGVDPLPPARSLHRERRRCVRQKVHTPAYASLNGTAGGMLLDLSEVVDISEDGISIQASVPLEVSRVLNLCLDLPETRARIYTTGEVIWSDRGGRAGIRFPRLPMASRNQLKEWLFQNALVGYEQVPYLPPAPNNLDRPDLTVARMSGVLANPEEALDFPDIPLLSLSALAAVKREIDCADPELKALLGIVAQRAMSFTGATGAALALFQNEEMICLASAGIHAPPVGTRLQIGSGFSGECIHTGRLLRCEDSELDQRVDADACRIMKIRSIIAAPIRSGESVCGLLEVFSSRPAAFTAGDDAIMKRLAQISLTAVHRAAKASVNKRNEPVPLRSIPEMPSRAPQLTLLPAKPPRNWNWRLPRPLFVSVGLTLLFVLGWLYAPSIRNGLRSVNATSRAAAAVPKTVSSQPKTAREVTDINGLRRQAELGDATAQFVLGIHYSTGDEVAHDDNEAAHWIAMAAEQNHPVAQAFLGEFYREGRGVPKNNSKAYMWLALARANGDQASRYTINALASRMSPGDRLSAEQQANEWLKNYQLRAKSSSK
jgi:putative methionine-R-sulfoxide reductase with GAF domain